MKIMILIEKTRKYRYAKENEIEETLNTVSYKEVKESKKKEANAIRDSEKE